MVQPLDLPQHLEKKQMWWSKYTQYCFVRNSTQVLNNFKKKEEKFGIVFENLRNDKTNPEYWKNHTFS